MVFSQLFLLKDIVSMFLQMEMGSFYRCNRLIRNHWQSILGRSSPLLRRCSCRLGSNRAVNTSVCFFWSSSMSCFSSESDISYKPTAKQPVNLEVNNISKKMRWEIKVLTSNFCFSSFRPSSMLACSFPQKLNSSLSSPGVRSSHSYDIKWHKTHKWKSARIQKRGNTLYVRVRCYLNQLKQTGFLLWSQQAFALLSVKVISVVLTVVSDSQMIRHADLTFQKTELKTLESWRYRQILPTTPQK